MWRITRIILRFYHKFFRRESLYKYLLPCSTFVFFLWVTSRPAQATGFLCFFSSCFPSIGNNSCTFSSNLKKIWVKIRETAINNSFSSIGWHRVTTATILSLSKQFFVRTERSLTICAASLSSTIITCNRLKLKKFKPLKIGLFLPVYGISSQYFAKIKYLVDQISKKLNLWSIVGFSSNSDF